MREIMDQPAVQRKIQYHHEYHQCLVYKTFNASKPSSNHGGKDWLNFQQTLDVIERTAKLMRGVKQIVYLTGWQYGGHDSKWPAWFEGNARLARPNEQPLDSIRWLMREARERCNTVVSLHLNMCDAYVNSPLWQTYLQRDVIERNADGTLNMGSMWDGEQSYRVSKTREWREGLGQQRIDRILDLLALKELGTVHIDVFYPRHSKGHGITQAEDIATIVEIIKYWHARGVDVTKEWFDHEFAGLIPMVWHYNLDEADRITYPASICCGGGSAWNRRLHLTEPRLTLATTTRTTPPTTTLVQTRFDQPPANRVVARPDPVIRRQLLRQMRRTQVPVTITTKRHRAGLLRRIPPPLRRLPTRSMHQPSVPAITPADKLPMHLPKR